jgi:hypothetical protein
MAPSTKASPSLRPRIVRTSSAGSVELPEMVTRSTVYCGPRVTWKVMISSPGVSMRV